jgi:hypothetical protein
MKEEQDRCLLFETMGRPLGNFVDLVGFHQIYPFAQLILKCWAPWIIGRHRRWCLVGGWGRTCCARGETW